MTKPKSSSSSLNPWEALLSSATRTRPSDTSNSSFLLDGGYTILLQHSMTSKSQRQFALESTIANVDSGAGNSSSGGKGTAALSSQFASSLSIMQQKQNTSSQRRAGGDCYGMSGPFLIRQAFFDLCKRCNGRVVFVSVVGTSAIWDLNAEDYNNDAATIDDSEDYHHQHQSSGDNDGGDSDRNAMSSFRRNGACVDLSSNPFGWNNDNNDDEANTTLHNLQSVVTAIQQAVSRIESSDQTQQQQPVPVIFDSLTPLLHLHGAERITILLKSLGRRRGASLSPLQHDNSSTATSSSSSSCLLSPIVAPVLYESISLSDHRTLEDCADAMVSLNLMNSTTTALTKDDNSIAVASGVLDLVRRGGGGANSLGGKLMRHCVPVHIFRSLSAMGDLRDGCYWIIDDGGSNDDNAVRDDDDAAEKKGRKQTTSTPTSGEAAQTQSEESISSRPKIYLEDDDPEFEDYDEDDDLDL